VYCGSDDLKDYVLEAYLAKAEELNPGGAERHLAQVSEEIDGALLQAGHALPLKRVPGKLKQLAAVITAFRVVSNITSLMQDSGTSGNEWLGLQTLHKQAVKDLDSIRSGDLDLFPTVDPEPAEHGLEVSTQPRIFGDDVWRRF